MIPHDAVQGTCGAAEAWQPASRPRHRVQHTSGAQLVELLLVAVSQGVAQRDQVLVAGLVAAPPRRRTPPEVMHRDTAADASDPDSPEVHLQATQVRVPSVDHPSAGRCGDQHGLRTRISPRQADKRLSREVMKVAGKRLELRNDSKDIGVRDRSADLQRPARTIDLAELRVRLGQRLDRLAS